MVSLLAVARPLTASPLSDSIPCLLLNLAIIANRVYYIAASMALLDPERF